MRLLLTLMMLLFALPAKADEVRPLYIESRAEGANAYTIKWRVPPTFAAQAMPALLLPGDCAPQGQARTWANALGSWQERRWQCRAPLEGRTFEIAYARGNPNLSTIFKTVPVGATSEIIVLRPSQVRIPYPKVEATAQRGILLDYLVLGVVHIWEGIDHLLFVACLIWIAGTPRRVLQTITGFTIAHSATLALAALELVVLPVRTIEVLIALSIVLLAVELARGRRDTLIWRRPVAVAAGFGLLHGFGFAAALREVGLPGAAIVPALFAFNLGIELGQLVFSAGLIAATSLALAVVDRARSQSPLRGDTLIALPAPLRLLIAYGVGITATCWMLQRAT